MDKVVIGLYGTSLDAPPGRGRGRRWRPTLSLFTPPSPQIATLELLYPPSHHAQADLLRLDILRVSPSTQVNLHSHPMDDPWDFEGVYAGLHDFARAYPFQPEEHEYLVHITTGSHVAQICLFLLTEARVLPGKLVQTSPPRGNLDEVPTVIDLDLARYDRIAARARAQHRDDQGLLKSGIVTRNSKFNQLIDRIEQVGGTTRAPILLTGPTGAGKSQLARQLYALKRKRRLLTGPLVEVNCATLRGDAAMSTLFGHSRGAFTGADRPREGLMRAAHEGCLFLDEVGELGLDEQAMLLRAIEDHRFLPLGSDREVESDFQLIAGTNRDLRARVAEGAFRADLLARIDLWTFQLPGLRQRPEDIEPNLDFELERWWQQTGRQVRMSREARQQFLRFATSADALWKGNFRDLNNSVTRMATLASGGRIDGALVDEEIARQRQAWDGSDTDGSEDGAGGRVQRLLGGVTLDRFDAVQLEDVLTVCAGARSLSDAGRQLFAVSQAQKRSSNDADRLRKYLARHGLGWDDVRGA
jgi:transcriptional regulatory protein RtcR